MGDCLSVSRDLDLNDIDPLVFCAHCGEEISWFGSFKDFSQILRENLVPGSRYLCRCGGVSVVDEKLDLRPATEEDIARMSPQTRREFATIMRAVRVAERQGDPVNVGEFLKRLRERDD